MAGSGFGYPVGGDMGFYVGFYCGFGEGGGVRGCVVVGLCFDSADGFFKQSEEDGESQSFEVSVLLESEEWSGSACLQVLECELEASAFSAEAYQPIESSSGVWVEV